MISPGNSAFTSLWKTLWARRGASLVTGTVDGAGDGVRCELSPAVQQPSPRSASPAHPPVEQQETVFSTVSTGLTTKIV